VRTDHFCSPSPGNVFAATGVSRFVSLEIAPVGVKVRSFFFGPVQER